MICHSCGREVDVVERVGFRQTCPFCDAWLHVCVQCRFWSGSICTETAAERVGDPEGPNYCEWFKEKAQDEGRVTQEGNGRGSAEEMWRKLTRK